MALQLDGGNTIIGTEFIKLGITGNSNLATEAYVAQQISVAGITGGSVDLSNYVQKSGSPAQVITGNLTVSSSFQAPNISTQFLNLRDADTPFKINRNGAEIIDIIPDPLAPANNEIRFHYDLEQQIGTKIRNYTYDTIGTNDVNFKVFNDDYISMKKIPLETMIFFKDINVSGNAILEGSLTANQGVIIPASASLSTDAIINVLGNDINIRTTGSNGVVFIADDVEKGRIDQSGLNFTDTVASPSILTSSIDTPSSTDFLMNINGNIFLRLRPTQDDIFFNKILTSFFDISTTQRVLTNTLNTLGDADLTFQRNGVSYLQMTSSPNTIVALAGLRCDNGLSVPVGQVLSVNNIINPLNNDVIVDATLTNNIVFRANATEQMRINSNGVQFNNFISLPVGNNINLGDSAMAEINAGYRIFQIVNPDPTGTFRIYIGDPVSFGNQIFWMSNTGIVCRKPLEAGILTSNYINSVGDNDVVFARNGVEFFRLANAPAGYPILNWTNTTPSSGISSSVIFANTYTTRSENTDTVFGGNPPAGTGARVEYVRYDYANSQLLHSCIINNTGRNVIGNLIDTTVSDEKLKYDIDDFNEECTECVKNVKIKTFKYKDEKYKNNDQYGMVAQELLKNLPEAMKGIVKENKDKDTEETFLSINYMKTSLILWKALQESISKISHLEASVYELQEAVKELKGKGKGKAKAKAKSKSKEN